MKTLHLNLIRKWFELIRSGKKKEEYRDVSNYFISRIVGFYSGVRMINSSEFEQFKDDLNSDNDLCISKIHLREYRSITFSNGYAKDRDQFEIELKGISIKEGNPDWGATPGKKYFVLELGELV